MKNSAAQNQSNEKSAVRQTAELCKAILARNGLSINAQNVKIIDDNGCSSLHGPVDSLEEKAIINTLAERCLGIDFRNVLEVKSKH